MDIFHALLMSAKPNKQTVFSYEIDTTKSTLSYRLSTVVPFVTSSVTTSYPSDVTIDWGDGTTPTVVDYGTSKVHNTQPSHTYATAGVYTITITTESGCMPAWGWRGNDSTYAPQLTKILTPFPTMYIFVSGDVALPYNFRYNSSVNQSYGIFFGCVNLAQLPTRLFKFNPQIISTYQMFRNCQSLASLPNDLGWYFTNIHNTGNMFYGCYALTSITSPIFKNFYFFYSGELISLSKMFIGSGVQTITATIFSNCKGITGATIVTANIFYGATNLINITVPMITGEISDITFNINGLFYNCYALNGDNVIAYSNLKTTSLEELYYQCRFTSVSNEFATYAKANTTVVDANRIFRGNTYLETVPDEVLAFPNAINYSYAFCDCTKLQINPNTFTLPENKATRFASLGDVIFENTFNRSSFTGTQGTAPDLWNYTFGATPSKPGCFGGRGNSLTSLTNYADIPPAWGGTA
jgi:hypothetical protein